MLKKGAKLKTKRQMHKRYESNLNFLCQNNEDLLKQQDRNEEEEAQNKKADDED